MKKRKKEVEEKKGKGEKKERMKKRKTRHQKAITYNLKTIFNRLQPLPACNANTLIQNWQEWCTIKLNNNSSYASKNLLLTLFNNLLCFQIGSIGSNNYWLSSLASSSSSSLEGKEKKSGNNSPIFTIIFDYIFDIDELK